MPPTSLCEATCIIATACGGHPELQDIKDQACAIRATLSCEDACPACGSSTSAAAPSGSSTNTKGEASS